MDQETFNMSLRKFLKMVGISSQREIEKAVAEAMTAGRLKGDERFPARITLKVEAIGLDMSLDGEIRLQ
jgi:hypothetical protein